jgi:hypothetical protein
VASVVLLMVVGRDGKEIDMKNCSMPVCSVRSVCVLIGRMKMKPRQEQERKKKKGGHSSLPRWSIHFWHRLSLYRGENSKRRLRVCEKACSFLQHNRSAQWN